MAYIKFKDSESPIQASIVQVTKNIIKIDSDTEPNLSGFILYLDAKMKRPLSKDEYESYTTMYRRGDGWYELSNDESTYAKSLPSVLFTAGTGGSLSGSLEQKVENFEDLIIPGVEADDNYQFAGWSPEIPTKGEIKSDMTFNATFVYIPTLDDLKAEKIKEMVATKAFIISQGCNAVLSDGTVEHFSLAEEDQMYLIALQTQVLAGVDPIPWHVSDDNIACKNYSNTDMAIITQTALNNIVYHVTYLKDITRYINSIEDKNMLKTVQYGMFIPEEYQSEPLKSMLAQMNA